MGDLAHRLLTVGYGQALIIIDADGRFVGASHNRLAVKTKVDIIEAYPHVIIQRHIFFKVVVAVFIDLT